MEHLNIEIKGKYTEYAEITAEQGYCFYDVNDEERVYFEKIFTPITDMQELARKYVVVQGNAEELNVEHEKERLKKVEDGEV